MKAAVWEGIRNVQIRNLPDPQPEPGGLVVRVRTCSICGTDLRIYEHGDPKLKPPVVIGHEVAGEVVALGEGIEGFRTGDRVVLSPPGISCGECAYCHRGHVNLCLNRRIVGYHFNGGFAEYMAVPATAIQQGLLHRIPEGLPFEHASITEPLACVINGQEPLRIRRGDKVLVIGAGPIGMMHALLARHSGAELVMVADLFPQRLQRAMDLGFDVTINAGEADLPARVRRLTGGLGADVIIVAAASSAAQIQAVEAAAKRGRISLFAGLPSSQAAIELPSNKVHYGELAIYGASASTPVQGHRALDLIHSGAIPAHQIVTDHVGLEELEQGMALARSGKSLKVVVHI